MSSRYPIATVINFCSNDYPYLRPCIDAVKPFSKQIIVPVCDHFFDGKPEDREKLDAVYAENSDVQFIEFPYDLNLSLYGSHSSVYWHNLSRMVGRFFLDEEIEYVLFLDCDEICDPLRFMQWLDAHPFREYDAVGFFNYWYFRESRLQAKTWEASPLLAKKGILYGESLMREQERGSVFEAVAGKKEKKMAGTDGLPMFHHYSWVRTKEQLLRKAQSWGHNWQRNWTQLIEEEFAHGFNGTDFVHGYEFIEVAPFVEIDVNKKPNRSTKKPQVRKLTHEELVKIDVSLTFEIPVSLCVSAPLR